MSRESIAHKVHQSKGSRKIFLNDAIDTDPKRMRPTRAEVRFSALRHNLEIVHKLAGNAQIMAVVKAEAYGHGLTPIAKELARLGVDYLAVSFLEEGLLLRREGLDAPILVMGGLVDEQIRHYLDNNLEITVSSVWKGRHVEEVAAARRQRASVHVKIDTGMGRIGQSWLTADSLFREFVHWKHLDVKGIFTHFATADEPDLTFARLQLVRFREALNSARRFGVVPEFVHAANSGALMQLTEEARFDMVRPGIMLYGWAPSEHLEGRLPLEPVMTLKTPVVFVKRPPADATLGYGATWTSPGDRWIATLPIGYGDGFPRAAGNRGWALLKGRRCPIVGRVSMDQITIDAGDEAWLGDEALLFGRDGERFLSLWELSRAADTIPYEILCGLTARIPRVYLPQTDLNSGLR